MRIWTPSMLFVLVLLVSIPALGESKEVIALQEQTRELQEKLSRVQRTIDENIGLMTNSLKRNVESVRDLQHSLTEIQNQLQGQKSVDDQQIESFRSKVNALHADWDKVNHQFETITQVPVRPRILQTPTGPAPAQVPVPLPQISAASAVAPQEPQAPPLPNGNTQQVTEANSELYQSAMEHYRSKDFETAVDELSKYLKTDAHSSVAINAQFYLAEAEYEEQDFEGALQDYTAVVTRLPDQAKAAAAHYKKALCLLELERQDEALVELTTVVQRYSSSMEAAQAAKKIHSLKAKSRQRPGP